MFIVVRNLKSSSTKSVSFQLILSSSIQDYCLKKGDIIKLGRIKFKVKDFRTESVMANLDNNGRRASYSPMKGTNNKNGQIIAVEDEFWLGGEDLAEEAIEIDCGVVDST